MMEPKILRIILNEIECGGMSLGFVSPDET